ncbi:GDSL-type esterase/lipase family protein [Paenibacillus sp. 7523-1]|uniref:GDSL-type esterase/lipase family protein n=1 Tax=Paenibacillus sp. 7523-1 TaxID=2022550 RepID=UPI000BA5FEA5|nr:GDSL-type esterase/lipase family protein [Paenibacillus sp. 7523-1]PAD28696.1 hypothetical protein CHH60_23640 [Paenibacillus sp. 7523-1]
MQAFGQFPKEVQTLLFEMGKQSADNNRKKRVATFKGVNRLAKKEGIVFIGDSIMEGFPLYEMYYGIKPIYNRGIAGDMNQGLLQNLQDIVYDLEPSRVILLIGINDLLENKVRIVNRIEAICKEIKKKLPDTEILVQSIYPVNNRSNHKASHIW